MSAQSGQPGPTAPYTIERGIPVPAYRTRPAGLLTAKLLEMKPGDSLLVPVRSSNVHYRLIAAKKHGMRFVCRTEGAGTRVCLAAAGDAR